MKTPPPIPSGSSQPPPPLPAPANALEAAQRVDSRRKTVLAVVIALAVAGLLSCAGIVGFALVFGLSAREVEVSEEILAAVLTIEDAAEWFGIEAKSELEQWDTDYHIDRSAQIYYHYNDEEESVYLNCNLTYDPKQSDALMSYEIEWGGLKLANRIAHGGPIVLEEASDLFRWGDASRFAFQLHDGERCGMAFVTRKGGKVFFLDCWGMVLEDRDEIAEFIRPHLEALERAKFQRRQTERAPRAASEQTLPHSAGG